MSDEINNYLAALAVKEQILAEIVDWLKSRDELWAECRTMLVEKGLIVGGEKC